MGKVKGDEKVHNEVANKRRKKRKKELDLLRRNVLEAKRKLREKTAPPKTHTSTLNKILNSFADRRQENDNKNQGFDSKGKKSGPKKLCNRLLPSRKPQVGIFANGSKGAEIKRVNLSLNESERARFEGDLQKVLGDVNSKPKESASDALDKILRCKSAEIMDTEEQGIVRIPNEKPKSKVEDNAVAEKHSGKRKLQVCVDLDGKTAKKKHSEIENMKVVVQYTEVKSEWKNSQDKKWKRSLFQDEEDDFGPVAQTGVEQLRFSPRIRKDTMKENLSKPKVSLAKTKGEQRTEKIDFNYGELGRMAATRYEELCTMVCAQNFETCLQEIPHIDPLEKVKQSLITVYTENRNKKCLRKRIKTESDFAQDSLCASSPLIRSHFHKDKYFHEDVDHERLKLNAALVSQPQGVCPGSGNLKNFRHREASQNSSTESYPLMRKIPEITRKMNKNIRPDTRGPFSSLEQNTSSMDMNHENSRISLRSDILEFLKIEGEAESTTVQNLNGTLSPRLAGLPSDRKRIMLRYLKEVNNPELMKDYGSIPPPEVPRAVAEETNHVQKYCNNRHDEQATKSRNAPKIENEKMLGHFNYVANAVESAQNPFDVNRDKVRKRARFNLTESPEIADRPGPVITNLGSASESTLARIPSDHGEFMLRYLQGVNINKPNGKDTDMHPSRDLADDKLQGRYLGDPLRRHQLKNTLVDDSRKNEKHVPAILRKPRAAVRKQKSNAINTALAREVLGFAKSKCRMANPNDEKVTSQRESSSMDILFEERETPRNELRSDIPFVVDIDNSINPERQGLPKNSLRSTHFAGRTALQIETPTLVNALYNLNKNNLGPKRDFKDDRFSYEFTIEPQNIANRLEPTNSQLEFNLQSPTIHPHQNPTDNVGTMTFHDIHCSNNVPIFSHKQRSDSRTQRVSSNETRVSFPGDQESQRFPVFFERAADFSMENRTRYDEKSGGWLFPDIGKPKVIIIKNSAVTESGEDVRHEANVSSMAYENKCQGQTKDYGAELTFPKLSQRVQEGFLNPAHNLLQNGRQNAHQRFHLPGEPFESVAELQRIEGKRPRQCVCENVAENLLQPRLPRIRHENGKQKIVDHRHTGQKLRHNPMSFFEATNSSASTSQRIFHHNPSQNNQIPAACSSDYRDNMNLGFVPPKSKRESFCHNAINLIDANERVTHCRKCSPVLSKDENRNYEYHVDPRCPQDGCQWNQIDQNAAQIHQRVIQPVYNVIDATFFPAQVSHGNFFSTDI